MIIRNVLVNSRGGTIGSLPGGGIGISSESSTHICSPTIENNTITSNHASGISVRSISAVAQPIISNNNILDNQNNLYIMDGTNVDATLNWWGTTDSEKISQRIYDSEQNFNLGTVTFVPYLAAPNIHCPTFVNASAALGGSVIPSGIIRLNFGDSQTFNLIANTGYHVADVLINGTSIGAVNTYTLQNVTGATTFSASFALNPTPTPSPAPTVTPTIAPTQTVTPIQTATPIQTIIPIETATPTPTAAITPELTPAQTASQSPTNTPTMAPTQTAAEAITPSPSVPEFPAVIVLPLLAVATLGILVFAKRKTAKAN